MRGRLLAVLVLVGVTGPAAAQVRPAASGSAEAAERLAKYRGMVGPPAPVVTPPKVVVKKLTPRPTAAVKTPAEVSEDGAAALVSGAKFHLEKHNPERAADRLRQAVKDYPNTKGAEEARKLLKELGEDW